MSVGRTWEGGRPGRKSPELKLSPAYSAGAFAAAISASFLLYTVN